MRRVINDKIVFDLKTEYMEWLASRETFKNLGYMLHEKSTIVAVAEKEYNIPFFKEDLEKEMERKNESDNHN